MAAAMPDARDERMTPRTISQRVAPSASAPSSSSLGTLQEELRLMLAMIGTTMIVRITIAAGRLRPLAGRARRTAG